MNFTTAFLLEEEKIMTLWIHVWVILAKLDPYVETFPKFYIHLSVLLLLPVAHF